MAKEGKKALVPKLRFPEFREKQDWTAMSIGRLCRIRTGKKDANEGAADGVYPFFTCAEDHIYSNSYSFDAEAILVAGNANVGQTRYYKGKFEAYQRTYVLTDFANIHVPYLYTFLSANLRPALRAQVQTSAMSYIRLPMLEEFPVAVPPSVDEQQKIADCLSSLDELIAAQGRKVEALKTYKRGLMQRLFPREGETIPRLRFPEFRDSSEWEPTTLDALVHLQSGGTPSKANPEFWSGSIPWVSAKDMKRLFLNDAEDHISAAAVKDGAKVAPVGTVLILVRGMTLLKDVPICVLRREMSFNQDVKALLPKGETEGLFVALLLLGNKQRLLKMVDIAGHGTGKLNTDELNPLELSAPKPAEQQRIADFLSSFDAQIAIEADKLAAFRTHKNGLMQQLFPSLEEK